MTAAGSVITDDVPAHALAIARGRQVTKTRRKQSTGDG
jgi:bifunctional N-acetylglucosamine-1-phosphate-uridyltransferase/glucosamine-1-phosphate-acetyltransferase GlmU-like protein